MGEYKLHRTALIDADIITYQLAAWAQTNQADALDVVTRIEEMFNDWMKRACCTDFLLCFSDDRDNSFRRDWYPLYKSNRSDTVPPAMLPLAQKALEEYGRVVRIPRLEADDVMGILATGGKIENTVIITVDKDLRQIPGWHFNPVKEDFPVLVSEEDADHLFFTQWLTGDSTDNFGGIKGVGPAKAEKILTGVIKAKFEADLPEGEYYPADLWLYRTVEAYAAAGMSWDEAMGQARCARILRVTDFDAETRTAIPWAPADNAPLPAWAEQIVSETEGTVK